MEQSRCCQVFVVFLIVVVVAVVERYSIHSQQHQVEAGQLEVKQNLVKFNNFVREKQGKVDRNTTKLQDLCIKDTWMQE